MKKKVGITKRLLCFLLVFLLGINNFAALAGDNNGSSFITKAEFDSLKNAFQSQLDAYNNGIDSKIDGAITSYLAGIRAKTEQTLQTIFNGEIVTYGEDNVNRWWKPSQPKATFNTMMCGAAHEDSTYKLYTTPQIITWISECNGKKGKQTVITYSATGTRDTSFPVFSFVGEDWLDEIQWNSTFWQKDRNSFRPINVSGAENGVRFSVSGADASINSVRFTDAYGKNSIQENAFKIAPFSIWTTNNGNAYDPDTTYSLTSQSSIPSPYIKSGSTWNYVYWSNGEHPLGYGLSRDWITAVTSQTYSAKRQVALNYASQKLLVFDHDYDTGWKMPQQSPIYIKNTYAGLTRNDYGYWYTYGYNTPFDYWYAMKPDKWTFSFSYNSYQAVGPGKFGDIVVDDWSTLPTSTSQTSDFSYFQPPLMAGWPRLMDMSSIYSNIKIPKSTGPLPTGAVEKSDGNYYLKWTAGTPLCYAPSAGKVTFELKSDSAVDLWIKLAPFSNGNPNSDTAVLDRSKINLTNSTTQTRAVRLPSGTSKVIFNVPSACYIFLKWGSTSNWEDGGTLKFPTEFTFLPD